MEDKIVISDIHLSRHDCNVKQLSSLIVNKPSKTLILNGDIFDQGAWFKDWGRLYRTEHRYYVKQIREILKSRGTKVYYLIGNHDWLMVFLMPIGFMFGMKIRLRLKIGNYLIEHGNLIRPYLKRRGIESNEDHCSDYLKYAHLRNKILIVGHSHWPINMGIVIDEGDWVKNNSYVTINGIVSKLIKY